MTAPSNIPSIEKTTNRSWTSWLDFFTGIDAEHLDHPTIVKHVYTELLNIEDINAGWWAQSITVAYEQYIGRRTPGQSGKGDFQISVSRTLNGTMDEIMQQWTRLTDGMSEFNGVATANSPRRTVTDKWRHWRVDLADGTLLTASVQQKSADKAIVTVTHTKLTTSERAEEWRSFWKEFLQQL